MKAIEIILLPFVFIYKGFISVLLIPYYFVLGIVKFFELIFKSNNKTVIPELKDNSNVKVVKGVRSAYSQSKEEKQELNPDKLKEIKDKNTQKRQKEFERLVKKAREEEAKRIKEQEKLRIEIEKKKQNVECYVTADVPPIKADKAGIERVILNVLSNAIKYTEEHGSIKIYVGFVYNDAYIKIIDNGIGIPKEDLGRIFERFYRVDKARTREMGGTGLGLSIAKEIIEQNNGSIDIKSEYGKGTEVVIRIPAMKKQN